MTVAADDLMVVKGHSDIYHITNLHNQGETDVVGRLWLPKLRATGQSVVFAAISGDQLSHLNGSHRPLFAGLEQWDMFFQDLDAAADATGIILTPDDVPDERDNSKTRFVLALEGGLPLESSLANFRIFYRLGMRSFQLTHDLRNELADGRKENLTGGGITRFGKAVVREANRLGVLLDVSHISDASFFGVLSESTEPVVATHANVRAVHDHPRNFTDEQIRLLAESGGMLNVVYIPRFIGKQFTPIDGLMAHIRHAVDLVGVEHVGIGGLGTDADHIEMFCDAGWPYERLAQVLAERQKDIRTEEQIPRMIDALQAAGFSDEEIRKIFGGNLLRVLKRVLATSKAPALAA